MLAVLVLVWCQLLGLSSASFILPTAGRARRSRMAAQEASSGQPAERRASCFCGRVRVTVFDGDAASSSSICHCSICRRLSGAPFLANVLFKRSNVALDGGDGAALAADALAEVKTSKHVARYRCASCASPVLATLGKDLAAVPLALFPRPHPPSWNPMHHMHYGDRVVDVPDGKTKFAGRFGYSQRVGDDGLPLPPAEELPPAPGA